MESHEEVTARHAAQVERVEAAKVVEAVAFDAVKGYGAVAQFWTDDFSARLDEELATPMPCCGRGALLCTCVV